MSEINKTCLYDYHVELGARMEPFASYSMPIVYTDIQKEHLAVRENVGMFDVSHMGEIIIKGKETLSYIEHVFTNEITSKSNGKVVYGFMCYPNGTIVDDLLVYKVSDEECLLVVNASNIAKDYQHLIDQSEGFDVLIQNVSDEYQEIALQGPNAELITTALGLDVNELEFFTFKNTYYKDGLLIVSRTGYTGEDGFELYGNEEVIRTLWQDFYQSGVTPCGLGARDTLRFEANLPLYGHEISDEITPVMAGYKMFCRFEKESFIGKEALLEQVENGVDKRVVGLELTETQIPRGGYPVFHGEKQIGVVTTGYLSISLKKPIALALVDKAYSKLGSEIFVQVRKKMVPGFIRDRKFLQKNYKK